MVPWPVQRAACDAFRAYAEWMMQLKYMLRIVRNMVGAEEACGGNASVTVARNRMQVEALWLLQSRQVRMARGRWGDAPSDVLHCWHVFSTCDCEW